jgi:hypothetical protein
MFLNQYIYSLSHQDALDVSVALTNAFLVILISILGIVGYEWYESRKDRSIYRPHKPMDTITTEHILFEYGTDQLAIEIHHYTKPLTAEFLRHLKEFEWNDAIITHRVIGLIESMERLNHPNTEDVRYAFDVILDSEEFREAEILYVYKWLQIAKTYWMLHPEEEMLPLELMEHDAVRSKSF